MVERLLVSLSIGLVVGFVAFLILLIVSALLPGVTINAAMWGTVFGILAAIINFVRDNRHVV